MIAHIQYVCKCFFLPLLSAKCAHVNCFCVCPPRYFGDQTPGHCQIKWHHWPGAWQSYLLRCRFTHMVASASVCADRNQRNLCQHCRYSCLTSAVPHLVCQADMIVQTNRKIQYPPVMSLMVWAGQLYLHTEHLWRESWIKPVVTILLSRIQWRLMCKSLFEQFVWFSARLHQLNVFVGCSNNPRSRSIIDYPPLQDMFSNGTFYK